MEGRPYITKIGINHFCDEHNTALGYFEKIVNFIIRNQNLLSFKQAQITHHNKCQQSHV